MTENEFAILTESMTLTLNGWNGRYSYATSICHACDYTRHECSWEIAFWGQVCRLHVAAENGSEIGFWSL